MYQKQEFLEAVTDFARQNLVTKEELVEAFDRGNGVSATPKQDQALTKQLGITEILYYIGGAIVFLGIVILLFQNWDTLNVLTRILVTLGSGIVSYYIGFLFTRVRKMGTIGSAFYLISALVTPIGLYVVFDQAGYNIGTYGVQTSIALVLFIVYFISYMLFRESIFLLFSILFGTWLFYSITGLLAGTTIIDWEFFEYLTLVVSVSYMLLGNAFSKNDKKSLSDFLYGFGVFGFLLTAIILGGWEPNQNIFWELIYPGLVFGIIFISVHIKSKAFLTFGTLFLMLYILKITSEYFTVGLGWPLALVLAGFSMIGVGYVSFSLKKKYLSH